MFTIELQLLLLEYLIVPIGGAIIVNASTKTQWLIEGYICSYNIVGVVDLITMLPLHTRTWSYPHFPTMFFISLQFGNLIL